MDPQIKSILTSIALTATTAIATWAASKGLIPSADQSTVANDLVTVGFGAASLAIAWYKKRMVAPTALIAAVNTADNGVKVVASTAPAPTVTAPLK